MDIQSKPECHLVTTHLKIPFIKIMDIQCKPECHSVTTHLKIPFIKIMDIQCKSESFHQENTCIRDASKGFASPSGKHVRVMNTPLNPTFI